jgi:alpha-galactosidase/6-phospho-beta-glucosidase family protein
MAEAKVAGKVVAVRENPDVQERVRLKIEELKQKNPKKYEEHKETFARLAEKLVKKDLEAEENQRKQDEALFERMRKKLSQAFYKELGIDENYIERHREQIERWERSVGKPQTIGDELDAAAGIAGGAVDNVNASRNKRNNTPKRHRPEISFPIIAILYKRPKHYKPDCNQMTYKVSCNCE